MTHQIQIQLILRITLLNGVCGISHPLRLCRKKGSIFGGDFGRLLSCLPNTMTWIFILLHGSVFFAKSVVGILRQLRLTLSILESLYKNKPTNIRMIDEAKKRWVQNPYGDFFTCRKINKYGLECFRCVCHELLSIISVKLIPSGWYFTGLIIMLHHPCTW